MVCTRFATAFWGSEGVLLSVDEPPVPSSLPIVRHRLSASTSFVLAALRALHVDSSDAVTGSAMIEEGTSSPWTWRFARNLSNTSFRTRELRPWIPQSTHIHAWRPLTLSG